MSNGSTMKRSVLTVGGIALAIALAGCASSGTLEPVGPKPMAYAGPGGEGQLEVFSAVSGRDPKSYQHTDYYICTQEGERLQHVDNSMGHNSATPRVISLPPRGYLVEAKAKDHSRVKVPVEIQLGTLTSVHLDGAWEPSADPSLLVHAPEGYPVGWRAGID